MLKLRVGPRHPRLAKAGYRLTRRLAEAGMARIGFHRINSEFARRTIDSIRERLQRGETVYVLGFAASGTHNTGVALIEITQAGGPRIVVNNEEERFSGEKHTTEYPRRSIDAMVEQSARDRARRRRYRRDRHDVGLSGPARDPGANGA